MKRGQIAMVMIILAVTMSLCTREKKSEQPSPGPSGGPAEVDTPAAEGTEDMTEALVDHGTPCDRHDYHFQPGQTHTLSFAVKLPPNVGDTTEFDLAGNPASIAKSTGMDLSISSQSFETYPVPAWDLDCSEAFAALEEAGMQKPISQSGGDLMVLFDESGYGQIVSQSGKSIEELPEETVRKQFGERQMYLINGQPTFYECSLTEGSRDGYIALIDLNVTVPASPGNTFTNYSIAIRGTQGGEFELLAAKRRGEPFYRMSGPDQRSECFD